jgi:mannose-6-phosphate isomerase
MTIEHACTRIVHKPWGSTDLRPWSAIDHDAAAIGELWFQRADTTAPASALLFKLLFTQQPLSIQVHPDDEFARSIGLAHGKTEAWYILSAAPNAKIAIGLKRRLDAPQLRAAIADGSISDLVQWRRVLKDDVIFVPAGTIHAIGAGLVLAEIQQRSDTTFRLFDHGRERALHVDDAVAAAHAGPAEPQSAPQRLTDARTLLVASLHFVLEQVDLAPGSNWELQAEPETWLLALDGHARVGQTHAIAGEAVFLEADCASIEVGSDGLKGLLAYAAAEPNPSLLRDLGRRCAEIPNCGLPPPSRHHRAATGSRTISMEARP